MKDKSDLTAHNELCDGLIRITNSALSKHERAKNEICRAIEAFRREPKLLRHVEELEQAVTKIINAIK